MSMLFLCPTAKPGVLKLAARGVTPVRTPLGDPVAVLALESL
jgi:hypothetical protein